MPSNACRASAVGGSGGSVAKFTTKKGTQDLVAEGHLLSFAGANAFGNETHEDVENKSGCHTLALAGAEGQELELVHPSGVEPETC